MSKIVIHPIGTKKDAQFTWTYVTESGQTHVSKAAFDTADEAEAYANRSAVPMWPHTPIEVLDRPYRAITSEDQAVARAANLAKAREAKAAKAVVVEAPKDEPKRRSVPGAVKAAAKAVVANTAFYPDRACTVCGSAIERTMKRGRPPATCLAHRDDKPAVVKVTPKGVASKPCACCSGPIATKGRGRPSLYCDKAKCQKTKAKLAAAKAAAKVKVTA